ncbi:uncharacterized protein [Diadema antillarum]|uniref:uncharacterized protein n=1 Tax=Diadema antillarum TaxID=105358 RepID=UPI003A88C181
MAFSWRWKEQFSAPAPTFLQGLLQLWLFLDCFTSASADTDPECANYDHQNYGCVGECISTSSCPGSKYISNLCPSQPNDVKCCFTADTDEECATYNHPTHGQVGSCISTTQCPYGNYISNLCPSQPAGIKCCFSKPTETCGSGGGGEPCSDLCGSTVKSLAQQILDFHIAGKVTLRTSHLSGVSDGADPYNNIRDTILGCKATRSSYSCAQGSAPGGTVCLSQSVLNYILGLANDGHSMVVNSLVGACHGKNSLHYQGLAVDLTPSYSASYSTFMNWCQDMGSEQMTGPGYPSSSSHVHCAFSS